MITVNNRPFPFQEGMTVQDVLSELQYVYEGLVIRVNDRVVEDRGWSLRDGDDLKIIHICHGG